MKHIELINQFREEISNLVVEVEASSAMGHFDINRICEDVFCGLFRELFDFHDLRNLNKEEKQNFPGIDLADDNARVAVQVTSDNTLDKVKDTLRKVIKYDLHERYDRIIIYVLTKKQASYSQKSLSDICGDKVKFHVGSDILDFRDISTSAANAEPIKLARALDTLRAYMRGRDVGLSDEDFDPPIQPPEQLGTNLIEVYFPQRLYIAEVLPEVIEGKKGRKLRNHRKAIKNHSREVERHIPSDFEASGGRLITFHDLSDGDGPFSYLIDEGTVEDFDPSEYFDIDSDHERVFKSLLRFMMQQKLFKHRVMWEHNERKFIFLPLHDSQNRRAEKWTGQKASSRMVFERKFKTKKTDEVLSTRHFAFSADFLKLDDGWFVSLTPDWFFSYGDAYRRSAFGDKLLSGLKRMEKNRSVYDQFRFLSYWLMEVDTQDLFSDDESVSPSVSFGDAIKLDGGRSLVENLWEPLVIPDEDEMQERLGLR